MQLAPEVSIDLPAVVERNRPPQTSAFLQRMKEQTRILKELGFTSLRPGQDRAAYNLMNGRDTFCVLPTGGGKSAIYIVPTRCADWCCIIFSPLKSLMQDQMQSLQQMRLSAAQISSAQTAAENMSALKLWEMGEIQFLFVAPERLESDEFLRVTQVRKPDMVTVDEAHCLSAWSDTFRPSYIKVGNFIAATNPAVVLAITATATKEIEADARKVLGIHGAARVVYLPPRENLKLSSVDFDRDTQIFDLIESHDGSTIVYCATTKRCDELFNRFGSRITGGSLVYHGKMPDDARSSNQHRFMTNDTRVMFATNAFGMGINKPDIRMIIHRDFPGSIEALSQEQGRAGRDGIDSMCVAFMNAEEWRYQQSWFIENAYPPRDVIERVYHFLTKRVDANKSLMMTGEDIASNLGLKGDQVNSALGALKSNGVIDREGETVKASQVRILQEPTDDKFKKLIDDIRRWGVALPNDSYDLIEQVLVAQTQRNPTTLKTHLKKLEKEGFIVYTLPYRGKTIIIKGDLDMVDFERLEKRKEFAFQKMDAVMDYHNTSDEDKHAFLTEYFKQ